MWRGVQELFAGSDGGVGAAAGAREQRASDAAGAVQRAGGVGHDDRAGTGREAGTGRLAAASRGRRPRRARVRTGLDRQAWGWLIDPVVALRPITRHRNRSFRRRFPQANLLACHRKKTKPSRLTQQKHASKESKEMYYNTK